MATAGLLEIKLFCNKNYDVIIFVHGVTNKIVSHKDVVICPKSSNASISMTEVIITSVL